MHCRFGFYWDVCTLRRHHKRDYVSPRCSALHNRCKSINHYQVTYWTTQLWTWNFRCDRPNPLVRFLWQWFNLRLTVKHISLNVKLRMPHISLENTLAGGFCIWVAYVACQFIFHHKTPIVHPNKNLRLS